MAELRAWMVRECRVVVSDPMIWETSAGCFFAEEERLQAAEQNESCRADSLAVTAEEKVHRRIQLDAPEC